MPSGWATAPQTYTSGPHSSLGGLSATQHRGIMWTEKNLTLSLPPHAHAHLPSFGTWSWRESDRERKRGDRDVKSAHPDTNSSSKIQKTSNWKLWLLISFFLLFFRTLYLIVNVVIAGITPHRQVWIAQDHQMFFSNTVEEHVFLDIAAAEYLKHIQTVNILCSRAQHKQNTWNRKLQTENVVYFCKLKSS